MVLDHGSKDDPNELKFRKGEILFIVDKSGKWWEASTRDGRQGSESPFTVMSLRSLSNSLVAVAPSNYLRLLSN